MSYVVTGEGYSPLQTAYSETEPIPLRDAEGFSFNEDLDKFAQDVMVSSQIRSVNEMKIESIPEGYIRRVGLTTESGHAYAGLVGITKHQTSDVPVIATSAWLTSTEGHNEHTVRNLMRLGNNVIFIGAEGSYRPSRFATVNPHISLANSGGALLEFSRLTASEHRGIMDPVARVLLGESRGSMVGMGVLALDRYFDQQVVFADLVAPCFPRRIKFGDIGRLASQVYSEPVSTAKLAGRLTMRSLVHYPATLDLHPFSVFHQAAIAPALLSGEAGELAGLTSKDKLVHITGFKDDKASMLIDWQDIFIDHPNVRITPLDGSHLTIADPETLAYILARNLAFQQAYQDEQNLNPESVFDAAHLYVDDILKAKQLIK